MGKLSFLILIFFSASLNFSCIHITTSKKSKNKDKLNYSLNDSLYLTRIISFKNLIDTIHLIKGIKKLYLFSYNCSPCRHSIIAKTASKYVVKDSISFLPTILVNCDNYDMLSSLNNLLIENKVTGVLTLNNEEFKSKNLMGTFDRLENFVKKYYPLPNNDYHFGYPYNIILDSNNNIIEEYPGAFD